MTRYWWIQLNLCGMEHLNREIIADIKVWRIAPFFCLMKWKDSLLSWLPANKYYNNVPYKRKPSLSKYTNETHTLHFSKSLVRQRYHVLLSTINPNIEVKREFNSLRNYNRLCVNYHCGGWYRYLNVIWKWDWNYRPLFHYNYLPVTGGISASIKCFMRCWR